MAEWKRAGKGGFGGAKKSGFKGKQFGEEREMFDAVCSNCGNDCQVPFKPSGKTPILCKSCFAKSKGAEEGGGFNNSGRQFGGGTRGPGSFERKNEFGTRTSFKGERAYAPRGEGDPRIGELEKGLAEANQKLDRLIELLSGVTLTSAVRKASKKAESDDF
jgi:CxxC-x17-CxxC domain-containing protein